MVTAILGAAASIFGGSVKLAEGSNQKKYGRLQMWLSSRDFAVQKDYTSVALIAALLLVLIILIVSISKAR